TDAGTIVVVDESYASYLGPPESAAALTLEAPNLLVLRSVSKGYCAGGLRVGYVVASAPLARAVREVAAPLAVSSLTLGLALERLGLDADPTHPALPWTIVPDPDGEAEGVLRRHDVAVRRLTDPVDASPAGLLRVAVPLSDARMEALQRLSAPAKASP